MANYIENSEQLKEATYINWYPTEHKVYKTSVLEEKHIEQVIAMMTKSFCDDEPMTRYVDMDYASFEVFARKITEKAAKDGLSIVATKGGKVVACTIVEDIADPADLSEGLTHKFEPIFACLENLTGSFFQNKVFKPHHLAHLFITAVDAGYRGEGLSRLVNLATMKLAAERNYSYMVCEFTNGLNEQGTVKYIPRKQLLGSCTYNQFEIGNKKVFAKLAGGANAYLWPLQQDAELKFEVK